MARDIASGKIGAAVRDVDVLTGNYTTDEIGLKSLLASSGDAGVVAVLSEFFETDTDNIGDVKWPKVKKDKVFSLFWVFSLSMLVFYFFICVI